MYHQLSKVTGRLVAATNLQSPLFPVVRFVFPGIGNLNLIASTVSQSFVLNQVPIALQRVEQPPIQYTAALSTVAEACPAPGKRNLVPGTNIPYPGVSDKIRQKQQLFQVFDFMHVYNFYCNYKSILTM